MAATGRNLLLEPRIKATEPDRNLLSNIHTVEANRKTQSVNYCGCSFTLTEGL